jgi:ubiquinol-cytochrome c reductase iron-sulfur subunit
MSTANNGAAGGGTTDSRFEKVREGARADGIEIVHYEPQFAAGSKAEKRMVRIVAFFFLISGLAAIVFFLAYIWWPFKDFPSVTGWEYEAGNSWMKGYTPILGLTLGVALGALGVGILAWGKKLLPHEIAIQERHDGGSSPKERELTGSTLQFIGQELGLARRPLLGAALALPAAGLGLAAVAVPVGMLIKDPHHPDVLLTTGFNPKFNDGKLVRLMREDKTLIRPEDVSVGGQITAFPATADGLGATNKYADSPVLLINLRPGDAEKLRSQLKFHEPNVDGMYGNLVAYSKICTHAGCPASLYEQQTNKLLCPCHQSQFLITENARPVFGPATRRLPMLPIELDDEGFLVAKSDFGGVPIGPAFWEMPQK